MARIETWYVGCINIKPKPKYGRNSSSTVLKLKNCSLSQKLVLNFFQVGKSGQKQKMPTGESIDLTHLYFQTRLMDSAMLSVQMMVFFCETYGLSKIDYFHTIAHLQKILSNLYSSRWMKHHICEQFLLSSCQRVEVAMQGNFNRKCSGLLSASIQCAKAQRDSASQITVL